MENYFVDAICQAAVEILGEKEAFTTLKEMGFPTLISADASRFSLEDMGVVLARKYNPQTAMGLLIRMGRASLIFLRRYFSDISELGTIENRLKPLDKRFLSSLGVLAQRVSSELDLSAEVAAQGGLTYAWQVQPAQQTYAIYYHFGLLEEFCTWLDSRKNYQLNYAGSEAGSDSCQITLTVKDPQ
ncbi:hypothetical protein [Pelolinea submarina]|uniref:Heme-NO-binding protein n=1 Tax=Pelolinea submarina TaxID=913107 RepID=A0A347ZVT1_9CHLR|nr:hypothetical protein [Pelolinea submarina]REG07108.1 hypothetical protein DFR64_2312 [Pelolinea submarina]BBB49412.1 hypothetical protein Pelsub_P2643 [Pelolinea submarina]